MKIRAFLVAALSLAAFGAAAEEGITPIKNADIVCENVNETGEVTGAVFLSTADKRVWLSDTSKSTEGFEFPVKEFRSTASPKTYAAVLQLPDGSTLTHFVTVDPADAKKGKLKITGQNPDGTPAPGEMPEIGCVLK